MGTSAGADPVADGDLDAEALSDLDGEPATPPLRLLVDLIKRRAAGLTFVCGLMLGWLVIGWWLWPVQWANSGPWELAAPYQERYVALVAANLDRGGDALQAKRDLAGWRPEALAALLSAMEKEAPDAEARRQLAALQKTLALQDAAEPPLWLALLRQTTVYWSAALAVVLLTAALALAIVPPRWAPRLHGVGLAAEGDAQSRALGPGRGPLEPWLEAFEEAAEEASAEAEGSEAQDEGGGEQPKDGEKPGGRPVERVFLNAEKAPAVQEQKEEQEQQDETKGLLADLLGGDEALDHRLEVLSAMIDDVPIDGLAAQAQRVLAQLGSFQAN